MAVEITEYGFTWNQITVERTAELPDHRLILTVNDLEIYVSKTGRTRAFRKGKGELK